MKIGFDGKRAANNLTGLGNYSRSLIAGMAQFFPQNQYFVYTPKIKDKPQISSFLSREHIIAKLPDSGGLLWRTFGIKKQLLTDNIDLFHGLSHEIPVNLKTANIPAVVTIHDLIFLKFPRYYGAIDRFIYKLKCRHACQHADKIIAISECTKRDVMEFFKTDPQKIEVVYQGCDDSFKTPASAEKKTALRLKFQLPDKYILNVGTIETRKNLLTLIRALKHVNESYKLVVIGKRTAYADLVQQEIDRLDLNSRVIFLQNVPFDELPVIYQMAGVFVYPSVYEGFGIPVIEALCSGVPVVAASGSCLEEAGGPGSIYAAPSDHLGFAKAINDVLGSPELIAQMKTSGMSYVQRFDHELLSRKMMNIYTDVKKQYA
ncbi:MAG TPA: glycosyltransferase family 1 protein [Pedobacter sp.]|uniref:glycosyltransferase family 4 protein n=1 Tax=Pedobacter sp. TaxID=1411316 RepID=UPI002C83E7F1|nr:glycosyltransferase family 1 protein [Pedobacter sp.]HMI03602.1 glycosyltransferase family 1 protein [Pedobacter sp.]